MTEVNVVDEKELLLKKLGTLLGDNYNDELEELNDPLKCPLEWFPFSVRTANALTMGSNPVLLLGQLIRQSPRMLKARMRFGESA
jgi:hypothetical protein